MIKGQDWASYQPMTPNTSGLDFAFVKITEGLNYINPRWTSQRTTAKKAGLVWGAYHYPHMANDPIREARFFLNQVAWQPGDIIVLDWEGYDSANQSVSKARQLAYRDAWLKFVKSQMPNHRVGMYCNTDYWLNVDKTSNCGDFLWIADYAHPAGQPPINYEWTFHQYTSTPIDTNVARFKTREELRQWALIEEEDMAFTDADAQKVVAALLGHRVDDPRKSGTQNTTLGSLFWWLGADAAQANATIKAQAATIEKLAGMVGKDVDTATVVAAVQQAIAEAVVDVNVTVANKTEATS